MAILIRFESFHLVQVIRICQVIVREWDERRSTVAARGCVEDARRIVDSAGREAPIIRVLGSVGECPLRSCEPVRLNQAVLNVLDVVQCQSPARDFKGFQWFLRISIDQITLPANIRQVQGNGGSIPSWRPAFAKGSVNHRTVPFKVSTSFAYQQLIRCDYNNNNNNEGGGELAWFS